MKPLLRDRITTKKTAPTLLQQFNTAALLLPGLLATPPAVLAAEDDEVDFGYSHYQEGYRQGNSIYRPNSQTGVWHNYAQPKDKPIGVDSLYGHSNIHLNDRLSFGFNFTQDTWAGATPYGSAPENSAAFSSNRADDYHYNSHGDMIITTASPLGASGGGSTMMDKHGQFYSMSGYDPVTGKYTYGHRDRIAHVMGYASPETRKQGDFKLGYEWDDSAANLGGGVSEERDYYSRFVNASGRWDFNQKRTSLNLGGSYTGSDINANVSSFPVRHPLAVNVIGADGHGMPAIQSSRQDWNSQLGLTQVINPDALLSLGMGYSRNTGFLSNPYKVSWMGGFDPTEAPVDGLQQLHGRAFYERRPDARNLWNWHGGWTQYIRPLDAALHFNYQFALDDWAINAHTFDADWVQPLGAGWSLTPRVRYYSQSAASFYQAYFVVKGHNELNAQNISHFVFDHIPNNFSSDQRLSGYGAISGGLTLSKQFTKGITLDTGFEYYSHQGGLKLGGGRRRTGLRRLRLLGGQRQPQAEPGGDGPGLGWQQSSPPSRPR
jgi:hypothetical protein